MNRLKVVHITAHLGGGVGRVLSRVASFKGNSGLPIDHTVICLEPTEKQTAQKLLLESGVKLLVSPGMDEAIAIIRQADIVQLEWWHHPLLAEWMVKAGAFNARLVIWSHTSGLHYPAIPLDFAASTHAFMCTTPLSLPIFDKMTISGKQTGLPLIKVVYSSGGFDDIAYVPKNPNGVGCSYGYLGSLNFAKLHPDIISFLAAVNLPEFTVDFYGDAGSNPRLKELALQAGIPDRVRIANYTDRPYEALAAMDVFVYLLNPSHYGTTENALLEAMASGAAPVVLNNPVECSLVRNGETGFIVDSPASFANAVTELTRNADRRRNMGIAARQDVLSRYSLETTVRKLSDCYAEVMHYNKKVLCPGMHFGATPAEWFTSCLGQYGPLFHGENQAAKRRERLLHPVLFEKSKSSVFHFLRYFPSDPKLLHWATMLENDCAAA